MAQDIKYSPLLQLDFQQIKIESILGLIWKQQMMLLLP